jgi:transcriptional regulator with XRE-family HTH domain
MLLIETDRELAQELGKRVRGYRIEKRMAQKTLASKAGIHVNTLRTLERSGEVRLSSFIAVLRALGERAGLEVLLATPPPPDLYSTRQGPPPQRVRERHP